ncbi:hypothetical protein QFC20_003025 [Naganishia adeliensis]|uniref:Uncharacterized protein n=1 Tax=Naganishia adeliensis TaxID=92952 RepID=A0ACC2WFC7_9TREE|nr:hypothetical protein QFC20_003025 [Naganishia adeliensis]
MKSLEDGLVYAYVKDARSTLELPKLVPPEGDIRDRLVQDTVGKLKMTYGKKLGTEQLAEAVLKGLSEEYWWEDMEMYVVQIVKTTA